MIALCKIFILPNFYFEDASVEQVIKLVQNLKWNLIAPNDLLVKNEWQKWTFLMSYCSRIVMNNYIFYDIFI